MAVLSRLVVVRVGVGLVAGLVVCGAIWTEARFRAAPGLSSVVVTGPGSTDGPMSQPSPRSPAVVRGSERHDLDSHRGSPSGPSQTDGPHLEQRTNRPIAVDPGPVIDDAPPALASLEPAGAFIAIGVPLDANDPGAGGGFAAPLESVEVGELLDANARGFQGLAGNDESPTEFGPVLDADGAPGFAPGRAPIEIGSRLNADGLSP